jgi:hypothetical protein
MLTRTKLRALSPGQWARIRVPEYECRQKPGEWSGPLVGKEVDICVIPCSRPRYECSNFGNFVKPFSNDVGDPICYTCDATGLVILMRSSLIA